MRWRPESVRRGRPHQRSRPDIGFGSRNQSRPQSIAEVLAAADDISFGCKKGDKLVIDKKMLDEITIDYSTYYLILENYVIGVLEDG